MTLAVVIPYYRKLFFEATLESLAAQTDKRFKVYIGDDASPDNPATLLERFKNTIDFAYTRFAQNLGGRSLTAQWHRCLEMVQEDWVMILGDDDVLEANVVACFHQYAAQSQDCSVMRFATQLIDENGTAFGPLFTHPELETSANFLFRKSRGSLGEYVFRTAVLRDVGFKDLPMAWKADVLAVLECSRFGTVRSVNEAVVQIRVSSASISGSNAHSRLKNRASVLFYLHLFKTANGYFDRAQKQILLERLGKAYRNDKVRLDVFLATSLLYMQYGFWRSYFGFLKLVMRALVTGKP